MDAPVEGGEEVLWRGLRQGTGIGALMGALAGAAIPCVSCVGPEHPWSTVLRGIAAAAPLLAVPGLVIGAMTGFCLALIPALVLAAGRGYFRRHSSAAAACSVSVGLALLLSLFTGRGPASLQDYLQFGLLSVPLAAGLVLAAAGTRYVLTGTGFRLGLRHTRPRRGS